MVYLGSNNKYIRELMIRKYGKKCMIEAAGIRFIPVSERKKIKGYRKTQEQLTYHHIKERAKGGQTTEENGAVVKEYNHAWLHRLSEEDKAKVNDRIQQYKLSIATLSISDNIQVSGQVLEFDFSETLEIPLELNTEEQERKRKFNRAKQKRETQRLIDESLEDLEEDEYDR